MGMKPTPGTGNQPPDLSSLCLALTEYAPLPMATVEGDNHIVCYVNPAFCRLLDRSQDQLVGKSFYEMLPEKGECVTLIDRVFRTGKPESHAEPKHAESHPVFWSYTAWAVMGNDRPVGVIIQVTESGEFYEKTLAMNEALILGSVRQHELIEATDSANIQLQEEINERKRTEQSRKDQLRFKDEFLSHVSHELRSPLTAIKQFTTLLLDGYAGEFNKEQREHLEIVLRNIGQLQSMIDDLLEVTRLETGKLTVELESVSVAAAVVDAFNTLQGTAREKGVSLSYDLPPDLPPAQADLTRLRQILIILLDNAIKFTSDGGVTTMKARLLEEEPRFLLLEVSDSGCGMSPEITERIFERLYQVAERVQTSRKGLGLGLYICKELVTRQGGAIWVKSQPEKGSTFSFTLPVFSLDHLLAPLLKNDKWPAESIALIMVEIHSLAAWPSEESQEEWSHKARGLLQRCILPDLDVLLPRMSAGAEGDRFFVAAFADDKGASVLTNRIREHFARLPLLKQTGVTLSVAYSMLPPLPRDAGASPEGIVTSMATRLEEAVKSHSISEVIDHE
jgi:two-component system NtrC family sensor kinase